MTRSLPVRGLLLGVLVATCGCTDGSRPASPSGPSLFVAQVGGIWGGQLTLTDSVARFESAPNQAGQQCLQQQFTDALGATAEATMVIDQTSSTLSARMTAERVGLACTYSGTASLNTVALNASTCAATGLVVQCPSGLREVRLVGSSILADVYAGVISGTAASTYNVLGVGGASSGPLGSMVVNQVFRAARR